MENSYPIINWLTFKSHIHNYFSECRPAIGTDGQRVVLGRTFTCMQSEKLVTKLYITDELENLFPKPFFKNFISLPRTRFAWGLSGIVFNKARFKAIGELSNSIYKAEANATSCTSIPNTLLSLKI